MGEQPDVVVVTGAGAGIGLAIARWHRIHGWSVVGIERDGERARDLETDEPGVTVLAGDVAAPGVLDEALVLARRRGVLRAWVNNAASTEGRDLGTIDAAHVERMLSTNIAAVLHGTRLAVAEFAATGVQGSIVAVSSVHARMGFAGHALYDTTKGAVEAMCRSVAAEAGHLGIRCNAVAPGAVMTEREVEARRHGAVTNEPIPLAMFSSPDEVAHVVGFLTGPESAAINGAVIPVDRGLSVAFLNEDWHRAQPRR